MIRMISAAMLLGISGIANANDKPINENVTLRNLDRAFELAAAALKTTTVIYESECADGNPAWCSFQGQGQIEIRGMAKTVDSPPSNISIFYTPDGDPLPFVKNIGLLVSICEPEMAQKERGKIISPMVQIAAGKQSGNIVEGKNCDYSVTNVAGTIMVVAEKSSD